MAFKIIIHICIFLFWTKEAENIYNIKKTLEFLVISIF
jgi:hypothetical protein